MGEIAFWSECTITHIDADESDLTVECGMLFILAHVQPELRCVVVVDVLIDQTLILTEPFHINHGFLLWLAVSIVHEEPFHMSALMLDVLDVVPVTVTV